MSTTILNFKSVTVSAASKEEAIAKIEEQHFHVNGDATQAYKNAKAKHEGVWTDKDEKAFKLDYLERKVKSCPGAGYYITVDVGEMILRVFTETIEDAKKFDEVSKNYKIHLTFCYQ